MENSDNGYGNPEIIEYLKNLDQRVSQIEERLHISPHTEASTSRKAASKEDSKNSEQRIGEFWFANLGIFILVFFFTFLIAQPYESFNQFIPPVIGLAAVLFLIGASRFTRKSFPAITNELYGSGLFILYVSALRLFNFSAQPAIDSFLIKVILLNLIPLAILYVSVRKKSLFLNVIGLLLLSATGMILDVPYAVFLTHLFVAVAVSYLYASGTFRRVGYLATGIFLTYFCYGAWILNNPFLGHDIQFISGNVADVFFLLLYMLIYASATLKVKPEAENDFHDLPSLMNSALSFALLTGYVLMSFMESAPLLEFLYFVAALGTAIVFWTRKQNKLSTYFYSMTSFVALSVFILLIDKIPHSLLLLIWQSLIIIGLAVWFKSKSIVISNFIIYMFITLAYFLLTEHMEVGGLSIGVVALLSARVLNWQKSRLTIQTEFLRIAYLAVAFFSIPIILLSVLDASYIGLAFIGLAILYYLMAIILSNFKYRWMAHLTLIASAVYIVGYWFTNESSFLHLGTLAALAATLIFVSFFFTKMGNKEKSDRKNKLKTNG